MADYCVRHGRNVIVLCSGWQDKVNIEDTLFGGALVDVLVRTGKFETASDAALIAQDMWISHKDHLMEYLDQTDHVARLKANHLDDSIPYCLTLDQTDKVPELTIDENILILQDGK